MLVDTGKAILVISGLFISGYLFGHTWHYLGDRTNIINRYLEAHNSRFINEQDSNQIYYVFYKDLAALNEFTESHSGFNESQTTSIDQLATVNIEKSSLPDSLNLLRKQDFIRFVFPGTFPFVCH